ncbi:MAG: VWA domain-containing protein [Rhodobacteraceae bacterium]|nr:VWA domain-containing protein [Paracoccaceae bacterium]
MISANKVVGKHGVFMRILVATTLAMSLLGWPQMAQAQQTRPLLVDGRQTVYQRVLTRPGALSYQIPNAEADGGFPTFQPLYIYGVQPDWYQIGPSISQGPTAWVKQSDVVLWKQNIVAAFTNSAGRKRQFLFSSQEKLRALMEHEGLRDMQAKLIAEEAAGLIPESSGVIAVEPEEYVDIVDQLYIMPILDFTQDLHPLNYEENLLLKLASVPLHSATAPGPGSGSDDFDAGIVFVFDTTRSMEPFIARTQTAVERIIRDLQDTEIGRRVQFGVVAFRDNPEAAPGLEYRTRTLLPLVRRVDQTPVIATIRAATRVADVNSPGFNEDSLAGVEDAVELTNWDAEAGDPFDARIVILITDAGPKDIRDPNARSVIGPAELQRAAQLKNVAVMTLHLQTGAGGAAQHAWAEGQYRLLSQYHGSNLYFGIPDGSPAQFEQAVTRLVTAMIDNIRIARNEAPTLDVEETGEDLVNLGLAMRLAYLGQLRGTQAPDVIEGWASGKAVEDPSREAIEPRLLVTKNEMATMADLLDRLLTLGEQGRSDADASSFFTQVRDVVGQMAQNPDRLINTDSDTLGGALEFLEDLPYVSQLLLTNEARWVSSAMVRRNLLDGMRQKLVQHRKWLHDPSVWTALYDGAPDGEYVFAMPFQALP